MPASTVKKATKVIGWREEVGLPELGLPIVRAKIDTGARTSALHATNVERFEQNGAIWVSFCVPDPDGAQGHVCQAALIEERSIKNTSGISELRPIISTKLMLARRHWHIELSLADRFNMGFDLILGRTAIRGHRILVNPGRSNLAGKPATLPFKAPEKTA